MSLFGKKPIETGESITFADLEHRLTNLPANVSVSLTYDGINGKKDEKATTREKITGIIGIIRPHDTDTFRATKHERGRLLGGVSTEIYFEISHNNGQDEYGNDLKPSLYKSGKLSYNLPKERSN